jgi:hypothetical protein
LTTATDAAPGPAFLSFGTIICNHAAIVIPEKNRTTIFHSSFGICNKKLLRVWNVANGDKEERAVDTWSALVIFLLGSGAGALLTAIFYSEQIRALKQFLNAASAQDARAEKVKKDFDGRKSA